jgi:16S rRNA (guanine527-N7)-methyltransferase
LPGIPLAIARPDLGMTLVETVEKKSAFQRQAKIELGLANIAVHCGRVEDMPGAQFDAVVSRAFAELADFIRFAGHLAVPGGRLYAMKGVVPEDEMSRLPSGWAVLECTRLSVPGLDAQRHLIVLERV